MTAKQRFLRVTNLLFLVLVAVQFLPDQIKKDPETAYIIKRTLVAAQCIDDIPGLYD